MSLYQPIYSTGILSSNFSLLLRTIWNMTSKKSIYFPKNSNNDPGKSLKQHWYKRSTIEGSFKVSKRWNDDVWCQFLGDCWTNQSRVSFSLVRSDWLTWCQISLWPPASKTYWSENSQHHLLYRDIEKRK